MTATHRWRARGAALAILVAGLALAAASSAGVAHADGSPTCAGVFGSEIVVHGQHIVGDYVTGLGAVTEGSPDGQLDSWPPAGEVGTVVGEQGGAAVHGGSGPVFHFAMGLPPGASFCNEQAHPGGFTVPAPHQ